MFIKWDGQDRNKFASSLQEILEKRVIIISVQSSLKSHSLRLTLYIFVYILVETDHEIGIKR